MAQGRKTEVRPSPLTDANLSIDRVAVLIGVHRSTVERLLGSRTLGYYQVGRRRVIGQKHLQHYLESIERKADSDVDSGF